MNKTTNWVARISLFVVFFWFGFIKLFGISPANGIVEGLLSMTLPFVSFDSFIIVLGVWEVLIGVLFLVPRFTALAFWLMAVQMFTTFGPTVFMPDVAWQSFAVPTLEGQYILKNFVLVALGLILYMDRKKVKA